MAAFRNPAVAKQGNTYSLTFEYQDDLQEGPWVPVVVVVPTDIANIPEDDRMPLLMDLMIGVARYMGHPV